MSTPADSTHGLEGVRAAADFAREVGIPKLEAEACRVRGAIALRQGELDQARRLAVRALRLATFHGMGLRQTAALVFMGRVERAAGDPGASARILHSAIALAERQGYQVQLEEAERELLQLGSKRD